MIIKCWCHAPFTTNYFTQAFLSHRYPKLLLILFKLLATTFFQASQGEKKNTVKTHRIITQDHLLDTVELGLWWLLAQWRGVWGGGECLNVADCQPWLFSVRYCEERSFLMSWIGLETGWKKKSKIQPHDLCTCTTASYWCGLPLWNTC